MKSVAIDSPARTSLTRAILLVAGCTLGVASSAAAQSLTVWNLPAGVHEIRPVGLAGVGPGVVIPYKAINERGVQLVAGPGLWHNGTFNPMPDQIGPGGEYLDSEISQFRQSPVPGPNDPLKGISVGLIKKPTPQPHAMLWDTRNGAGEGSVSFFDFDAFVECFASSTSMNGSVTVGAAATDHSGSHESQRAVMWTDPHTPTILENTSPDMLIAGTAARGVSGDGSVTVGVAYKAGVPASEAARGAIWGPDGHLGIIDITSLVWGGVVADSIELKAVSDDGHKCLAAINTTRANAKGAAYFINLGTTILLDAGDINLDGIIDLSDDHDSAANAMSASGSIIGGSITLPGGPETAAIWLQGPGGYNYYDLASFLNNIGGTGNDGFTMNAVTGISADGLTLTGYGTNAMGQTTGWVATVPTPGALSLVGLAATLTGVRRRRN